MVESLETMEVRVLNTGPSGQRGGHQRQVMVMIHISRERGVSSSGVMLRPGTWPGSDRYNRGPPAMLN